MKARFPGSLGSILLGVALGCGTAVAVTAESAAAAPQDVHPVYCQTPEFSSYVKFTTPSRPAPGGGPICYEGTGTSPIDLAGVTRFSAGAHSGSFQYHRRPGLPIIRQLFSPGQGNNLSPAAEIISLTISS
jgi:hypothetical protein